MDVKIAELKVVANQLFAHIEQNGHDVISIPHEYYWSIPKEANYDVYSQPSELTLGQLSEDMMELQRIIRGEAEPLSYALVWLASVIRVIGEEIVA